MKDEKIFRYMSRGVLQKYETFCEKYQIINTTEFLEEAILEKIEREKPKLEAKILEEKMLENQLEFWGTGENQNGRKSNENRFNKRIGVSLLFR